MDGWMDERKEGLKMIYYKQELESLEYRWRTCTVK